MKKVILSAATVLPLISLAHPGHGETEGYTIIHYLLEPLHAAITVGAMVVLYAAYRYFLRSKQNSK